MIKVKELREVVKRVYNSRENKKNREKMNRYLKNYNGELWAKEVDPENKTDSGIFINLLFATAMTIAPTLTDNKPIWGLRARKPFMQKYIEMFKDAADCLWDIEEMDMKLFDVCLCALVMKIGYFKVFFDPEREEGGEVAIEVVDPREFVMCPGYVDPWDAPWCGEVMRKPLDWIRRNFPEHGMNIKADEPNSEIDYEHASDYQLTDQFATIYQIWVKDKDAMTYLESIVDGDKIKTKKVKKESESGSWVVTFGEKFDKFLEKKPYKYNHKKAPYIPLYDYKVPFHHMGMGEFDQLDTINKEYNMIAKKIAKYIRMYFDPNWLNESNNGLDIDKFKKDIAGGGNVFTYAPGTNPPVPAPPPPPNQLGLEYFQSLPKVMDTVSGMTDTSKGITSKKQRQSAHEISVLLETSYTRTRQRVRNLEWSIKRVFQLILEIMQEYYTNTRTFGTTDANGHEWFQVSSNPKFAEEAMKPREPVSREDQTGEEKQEDQQRYDQEMKDYDALMKYISDEDSVYAKFDVVIDTNSTLPLDKQSLANLCLQMAEMQFTPNSGIDLETFLDVIQFPYKEKVLERQKNAQKAAMQAQQGGQ